MPMPCNINVCRGDGWGTSANQNCYKETEPIFQKGYWESETNQKITRVVESAIEELKSRGLEVQMLNITQLSEYRKDAHPSIYRKQRVAITEDQLLNPTSYADCAHWCLPGVPDAWNEILPTDKASEMADGNLKATPVNKLM
ncbi:Protein trichome birefringence-like 34 [Forsythia ovata]|uniref:Protein trichome birefringence-like 34 n=1 Tax=Forsythia ovata TaxID=205694 RepID=A0ABD1SIT7_9LAMI